MPFSLSERDLDLIQLEELHSDSGYAEWFAGRIGLEGWHFESARHSVVAEAEGVWGESDLLALYRMEMQRTAVLIEDKIAAAFTERQAERYHERGRSLVEEGQCEAYRTVLVAPARYLATAPPEAPWHDRLPIEDIAAWFEARSGHHAAWRGQALRRALAAATRSVSPNAEDAARFSLALAEYLAHHYAPTLWHNPGRDSSGPIIRFPGSSVSKTLWWKFATHQMTLQLMGEYQGLAEKLDLPMGVGLNRAEEYGRRCDYLIVPVPPVDPAQPFDEQLTSITAAIEAALVLLAIVPQLDVMASDRRGLAQTAGSA